MERVWSHIRIALGSAGRSARASTSRRCRRRNSPGYQVDGIDAEHADVFLVVRVAVRRVARASMNMRIMMPTNRLISGTPAAFYDPRWLRAGSPLDWRAMAGNAPRRCWHSWQPWQRGICKLQNVKEAEEFESHSLRQLIRKASGTRAFNRE